MVKPFRTALVAATLLVLTAAPALAGSPHFVGTPTVSRDGDTLTVAGKIAGLGNETQVHVELSADAACVNRGGQEPVAENKDALLAAGDFPVQNGKALFELSGSATTDPDCSPPMTLVYSNVTVTDTDHDLSFTFPGTF
jgi:hypothetical protein